MKSKINAQLPPGRLTLPGPVSDHPCLPLVVTGYADLDISFQPTVLSAKWTRTSICVKSGWSPSSTARGSSSSAKM